MTHVPGDHGLLSLYGCDEAILKDQGCPKITFKTATQAVEATVLAECFHTFGGTSDITGALLLAESRISIYTWPEHRFATTDTLICGGMKLEKVREVLYRELVTERNTWAMVEREGGIV